MSRKRLDTDWLLESVSKRHARAPHRHALVVPVMEDTHKRRTCLVCDESKSLISFPTLFSSLLMTTIMTFAVSASPTTWR